MSDYYRRYGKRFFDILGASTLLLVTSPITAAAAVVVWLDVGTPVIFRQERTGLHGRGFILYKFRTMTEERDADGRELPDAQRVTSWGQLLRGTSVDELPELWNVLRGDMSLVGPRPLLPEYLEFYTPDQSRRHLVRPGLTGIAQVSGRNATTWDQRLSLDYRYVDELSWVLDVKILLRTVQVVLSRSGISNLELQPFDVAVRGESNVA